MKPVNAGKPEAAPAAADEAAGDALEQSAADTAPVPESGTDSPNSGPDAKASDQPKTMLEAIERGLDGGKKDASGDEGDEAEAAPADSKPQAADKKAKAEKPKADDADEDFTPPEGLAPRSEGRFKKLVERTKEAEGKFQDLNERWTTLEGVFRENGVQQEQFESAVSYIGALNRGDIQAAQAILQQELQAIALLTGQDVKVNDPLESFSDLKEAVENLEMPRAKALELARFRMANGYQQQEHQQHQERTVLAQRWEQDKGAAIRAIDAFVQDREKNDLDYAVKGPIMQQNVVKWCEGLPPQQWPAQIKRMYEAIGMGARGRGAGGNADTPRPLRGGGMGAGAKPAPRNMHEAMWGTAPNA